MPQIQTDGKPLEATARMSVPAMEIPCFRTMIAVDKGVQNKILIHTCGGIGDYLCAEPAIRYACNTFKDTQVYVASHTPEFFTHLPLAGLFDTKKEEEIPKWNDYFVFKTIHTGDELACQFLTHIYSHVVDYHTLLMFRVQISNKDRCIQMPELSGNPLINPETDVVVHPGRTWQSRTFSADWWDGVLAHLLSMGLRPVIIGAQSLNQCGTVDVNPEDCLDLRGKLSLLESAAVTHTARVVLTNDSCPLHLAAAGNAWIGFLSTVRNPDTLLHYRNDGEQGWRMKNFSTGWVIQELDMRPSNPEIIRFDTVDPMAWLPNPRDLAEWAKEKIALWPIS